MSYSLFPKQQTDDESLSQTNADIFDIASDGVYLALAILQYPDISQSLLRDVLRFLLCYADWTHLDISDAHKRQIAMINYGEEEVEAMEEANIPMDKW